MTLGLQVQGSKRLLILGYVLPQYVPKRLGLLRTEKNRLMILNGHLLRAIAGRQSEDKLEVPHTYAHLHAVGIGFTIIGGLREVQLRLLRLLRILTHIQ